MIFLMTGCTSRPSDENKKPVDEGPEVIDKSALDLDYYSKFKDKGYTVSVYNWGEYISDGADGTLDVNKAFEEVTGIKVVYSNYDTNESLYAKLKTGGSKYDVIVPSDYMISRLIADNLLLPIDFKNVPNIKNIDPNYMGQSYDPDNRYSVPFTWGVVGIIYNTQMVDDPSITESWSCLWDEDYQNNILMIGNSKDAFGIAFKLLDYPINAENRRQVDDAVKVLKEQKNVIQAYVADEIFDKMIGAEAAIAPYYNGDAVTMMADNPDLAFSIPHEGSNIFTDCMCIPSTCVNKEVAEMYINFMLEPQVGRANIETIGYSTPNTAVYEILDEEIKNNPVAYPPQEVLDRCEYFYYVGQDLASYIDEKWPEILTADERYNAMIMPMFLGACAAGIIALNVVRMAHKKRHN